MNFSHKVLAPKVDLVNVQSMSLDRAELHATGCAHTKKRFVRGAEYISSGEFDLTKVGADDYFHVAPCARKA